MAPAAKNAARKGTKCFIELLQKPRRRNENRGYRLRVNLLTSHACRINRREVRGQHAPAFASVVSRIYSPACSAEVDSGGREGIGGHGFPQHGEVSVAVGEAAREQLPGLAAVATSSHRQLAAQ